MNAQNNSLFSNMYRKIEPITLIYTQVQFWYTNNMLKKVIGTTCRKLYEKREQYWKNTFCECRYAIIPLFWSSIEVVLFKVSPKPRCVSILTCFTLSSTISHSQTAGSWIVSPNNNMYCGLFPCTHVVCYNSYMKGYIVHPQKVDGLHDLYHSNQHVYNTLIIGSLKEIMI